MHIADEVLHFVVGQIEPLELALHLAPNFSELALVRHVRPPT